MCPRYADKGRWNICKMLNKTYFPFRPSTCHDDQVAIPGMQVGCFNSYTLCNCIKAAASHISAKNRHGRRNSTSCSQRLHSTRKGKAEKLVAFRFVREDGRRQHSRSSALSTIRSQARRHANSERRRRNTHSVGRRQLLQRAPYSGPSLPERGSDDASADVEVTEHVTGYQSSTLWIDEDPPAAGW
jgi:hypothetical protein